MWKSSPDFFWLKYYANVGLSQKWSNMNFWTVRNTCTDMHHLTTSIRSEKCAVRWSSCCAKSIQYTYASLGGTAYCTHRLYGIPPPHMPSLTKSPYVTSDCVCLVYWFYNMCQFLSLFINGTFFTFWIIFSGFFACFIWMLAIVKFMVGYYILLKYFLERSHYLETVWILQGLVFSFGKLARPVFSIELVRPHWGNTFVSTFPNALCITRFPHCLGNWIILSLVCAIEIVLPTPFWKIFSKRLTLVHLSAVNWRLGVGSSLQTFKTPSLGSSPASGTLLCKLQIS